MLNDKMYRMKKAEIKEMKKDIKENGIDYYGYYYRLHDEISKINFYALIDAAAEVGSWGYNSDNNNNFDAMVVTLFCDKIGYQDFKKVVPYLVGRTHYKLINNQLVSTEVF